MRMPIAGSGPTDSVRVQNEVAAMALTAEALVPLGERIVPRIYGWESADSKGWVLCDRMPGIPVRDRFFDLDDNDKRHVIAQMGQILRCLQQFQVPSAAAGFGGLNFDADGNIVAGPTSIPGGGPCSSHGALYAEILDTQLALAKSDGVVRGWAETDLPERFEKVKQHFVAAKGENPRPTLVHGDFGESRSPVQHIF